MTARDFAREIVSQLRQAGHQALWAGGCVRDQLLGREPADYDVATSARPNEVQRLFRRTIAMGASFGVIEVLGPKPHKVQVATFRADGPYSDGRRPDSVTFASAEADALRRDFTMNGLFYDPLADTILDYVGGRADLAAGVVRAIGMPQARFQEDKLRLLRAVRFATRFDFQLEPQTAAAIRELAREINVVSAERIAEELRKLLAHPRRAAGVQLLQDTLLFTALFPEVPTIPIAQLHKLSAGAGFPLALATLLHARPTTVMLQVGLRLKLSNAERDHCEWLVARQSDLLGAAEQPRSRLYPLLAQPGIQDLIELHRALGHEQAAQFAEHVLRTVPAAQLSPPPLVTGNDLQAAGLKPGPYFKKLLDDLRTAQLDGRVTTTAEALQLARTSFEP